MKRITAIFFLLTFLIANTGMAVNVHYCGGKLSSINFFSLDNHPCKCGKKAMKKDCCKDKTTFLKMKDDVVKSNITTFKITTLKHIISLPNPIEFVPSAQTQLVVLTLYHPPPFKPKAPIYLLDRVLLI
jgi:hypothetical protein